MKHAIVVLIAALMLVTVAVAENPVVVKGHTMGESVSEFAKVLGYSIDECREVAKLTSKEAHKRKLDEKYPVCRGLVDAEEGKPVTVSDEFYSFPVGKFHLGTDYGYHPVFRSNSSSIPEFGVRDWAALLEHGRLVEFWTMPRASYSSALSDLREKFGEPTKTNTNGWQNSYGARYTTGAAFWKLPDGSLVLLNEKLETDRYRINEPRITIYFATKERVQEFLSQLTNQKKTSVLD